LAEAALRALVDSALAAGRTQRALEVLRESPALEALPSLLLLRARTLEQSGWKEAAAQDYQTLFYRFPLSEEARAAEQKLTLLSRELGPKLPAVPRAARTARAEALYFARRWPQVRTEYAGLALELSGAERERARLREAEARARAGLGIGAVSALKIEDADVEAERLSILVQLYRGQRQEAPMRAALERLLAGHADSRWADDALFAAAGYYWTNLDRARAAELYRRLFERFPESENARTAHWRVAWAAYLERGTEATALFEEHLKRFAGSPFTSNALYWLGRLAERDGNIPHARSFYILLADRFPQSYFAAQGRERLTALGAGPTNPAEVSLPSPPPARLQESPSADVAGRRARAEALRMIALDAEAEREFRAAFAASGSPALLLEAARAASDAGRIPAAISAARQAVPQLEARRWQDVPEEVWRLVYPMPYAEAIQQNAGRQNLDPMLVAALIRQESLFQSQAVSRAGALGLMQVMPRTGQQLARQLGLGYSRARLFQPEYNLRLGTTYLSRRIAGLERLEYALAAYNAGFSRVQAWRAERLYEEPAEFVESIPLAETREYVQIVMRNLEIYRRLYGKGS
jgi:soluble lytic murein transglycosylase